MSEPLIERLSRFTPNTGGLDRDALLFAAGRASVRTSRWWKVLAGFLGGSQVLTLALLLPRTINSQAPTFADRPALHETNTANSVDTPALVMNRNLLLTEAAEYGDSGSADPMVPSDPPLHAFGSPSAACLD
jgi:hypothetical protein